MKTHDFGSGPVPAHRHPNGGGWVADTACVDDTAYVGRDAKVYGRAWVSGFARVHGHAKVYGYAQVHGSAEVSGCAQVYGRARVYGSAEVYDDAEVYGAAYVGPDARVYGDARVSGDTMVYGSAEVYGDVWTWGNSPAPSLDTQRELAARILAHVEADPTALNMGRWHCGSSHCIAGWVQVLSGYEPDDETAYEAGVRMLPAMAPWFHAIQCEALDALRKLVRG